jgi:hypothetical protein
MEDKLNERNDARWNDPPHLYAAPNPSNQTNPFAMAEWQEMLSPSFPSNRSPAVGNCSETQSGGGNVGIIVHLRRKLCSPMCSDKSADDAREGWVLCTICLSVDDDGLRWESYYHQERQD